MFIFQIYDLPNFLSGEDREKCQHIRIQYFSDHTTSHEYAINSINHPSMKLPKGINQFSTRMSNSLPNSLENEHFVSDNTSSKSKFSRSPTFQFSSLLFEQRRLPEPPRSQSKDDYEIKSLGTAACMPKSTHRKKATPRSSSSVIRNMGAETISSGDLPKYNNLIDRNQTLVDIYILSDTSKMPMYMHSTWENYLMVSSQ